MGKFILTESDKNEILKMYGRINEQAEQGEQFRNKKFNVYSDPENSKFKFAVTISDIDTTTYPKGAKIMGLNTQTQKESVFYFDCTKNDRLLTSDGLMGTSQYSLQLTKALTNEYCQKNKSNQWVPKADYASTGGDMGQNLA